MKLVFHPATGEKPTRVFGDERPGDSTMGLPELVAIEREAERVKDMGLRLEVGVYHGRTSVLLAQIGKTVLVDSFGGNLELAPPDKRDYLGPMTKPASGWDPDYQLGHLMGNLHKVPGAAKNVILVAGRSEAVLPILHPHDYSFILLDADKSEQAVFHDLEDAVELLTRGGTLVLDDWPAFTHDETKGTVERAWKNFAKAYGYEHLAVHLYGVEPGGGSDPKTAIIRFDGTEPDGGIKLG